MTSPIPASSPFHLLPYPIEDEASSSHASVKEISTDFLEKMPPVQNSDMFTFFTLAYNKFDLFAICPFKDPWIEYREPSPIPSDGELSNDSLLEALSPTQQREPSPIPPDRELSMDTDVFEFFSSGNLEDEFCEYALQENVTQYLIDHAPSLDNQEEDCDRSSDMTLSVTSSSTDAQDQTAMMSLTSGAKKEKRGVKRKQRSVSMIPLTVSNKVLPELFRKVRGRFICQYMDELYTKKRHNDLFGTYIPFKDMCQDFQKWTIEKEIRTLISKKFIKKILHLFNIRIFTLNGSHMLDVNREDYLTVINKIKHATEDYDGIYSCSPIAKYISSSLGQKNIAHWNFGGTTSTDTLYSQFNDWRIHHRQSKRLPEDFRSQFPRWLPCIVVSDDQMFFSIPSISICQKVFDKVKKNGWSSGL